MAKLRIMGAVLLAVLVAGCGLFGYRGDLPLKGSGAWKQVSLGPDDAAPGAGLYFRDMKTGKTEGWRFTREGVETMWNSAAFPSDDFAVVIVPETAGSKDTDPVYLINRVTDKAYEWTRGALSLVAASPTHLVFHEPATGGRIGKFHVTDAKLKSVSTFKLPVEANGDVLGIISPDGKTAFVVPIPRASGRAEPQHGTLYRVELPGGQIQQVAAAPPGFEDSLYNHPFLRAVRDGNEVVFGFVTEKNPVLRRYAWDGKPAGELRVPGLDCDFTKDGSRAACSGGALPVRTEVVELATGQPLYRVLGAADPAWAADGALVFLRSDYTGNRIVTADGRVSATEATKLAGALNRLAPAPADANLFALKGQVVDSAGKVVFQTRPAQWEGAAVEPWGKAGAELRYLLKAPRPIGLEEAFDLPFEPKYQKAPFPAEIRLQIQATPGDCLNLRREAGKSAGIIRCLAGGTKVTLQQPAQVVPKDNERWVPVRLTSGEAGWIAITTGNVGYAD